MWLTLVLFCDTVQEEGRKPWNFKKGCERVVNTDIPISTQRAMRTEEKMERKQKFLDCRAVSLEGLPGSVLVKLSEDDSIHVEIMGSQKQVLAVQMQRAYGKVVITYPESEEKASMQARMARQTLAMIWRLRRNRLPYGKTVVTHERLAKLMNAAGWQRSNRQNSEDLQTVVAIPPDLKIFYNGAPMAFCEIMDTQSNVDIELPLGGKVMVQAALNLSVRANANGSVTVKRIESTEANLELDGGGSITVLDGRVRLLRAQIRGSGDIRAMVTAQNAKLSVTGDGDMKVFQVTGRLAKNCTGTGEIVVYGR